MEIANTKARPPIEHRRHVEAAVQDFLASRGVIAEPEVKLSRNAAALFDAAECLTEGRPDADLSIPYSDVGQELLDAGRVARKTHANDNTTYRLTAAGER